MHPNIFKVHFRESGEQPGYKTDCKALLRKLEGVQEKFEKFVENSVAEVDRPSSPPEDQTTAPVLRVLRGVGDAGRGELAGAGTENTTLD
jgi:hypothetical protein